MAWLRGSRLRWVIVGAAVVAALFVAAIVAWPHAQRYTGRRLPLSFTRRSS
jgi:hypothetical protein